MKRGELYIRDHTCMTAKGANSVCGDVISVRRSDAGTLCVLCDGLGSGISANLAAAMAAARLLELTDGGFGFEDAFARVVTTLQQARGVNSTYAAMTAVFIRSDGAALILGYEAPPVLWISRGRKVTLPISTTETLGKAVFERAGCFLAPGEALVLVSDGITQAGLGREHPHGLPAGRIAELLELRLRESPALADVAGYVHRLAMEQWLGLGGDDCSVCVLACGQAEVLTIMTGPPADRRRDVSFCEAFLRSGGAKAVCGGTTAGILSRCTGRALEPLAEDGASVGSLHTPPRFRMDGIDLVAEGAVTLNQTLNVLDLHERRGEATSAVSQLLGLLYAADHIRFFVGRAENAAGDDVLMRQLGVRQRLAVVQRLDEALTAMGKLVTVRYY